MVEHDGPARGGPRSTFPPYSTDEVGVVRAAVAAGGPLDCPVCGEPLQVEPFDMMGMGQEVFELRCDRCRRFLIVRDLPDSLR